MKTLILAAIRCFLLFLVPTITYAISAQWDLDPISGDWNTAANWSPMGVPNGPADIATFDLSNTTDVSISANTEVNGITFTSAATNPYTITASSGLTLTISGAGIANNSGVNQTLMTVADASGNFGTIRFFNSATAGSNVSIFNEGGSTNFFNSSTAGSASIQTDFGSTNFFNTSTAGNASIVMFDGSTNFFHSSSAGSALIGLLTFSSVVNFFDRSTAGNASIDSQAGSTNFFHSSSAGSARIDNVFGLTNFFDSSSAGSASIVLQSGGSGVNFFDRSTAGSANLDVDVEGGSVNFFDSSTAGSATISILSDFGFGAVSFFDNSTAGNASISLLGLGAVSFFDNSTAGRASISISSIGTVHFADTSQGGTARIGLNSSGILDISAHNAPGVTIGSIEGEGNVFLGANNLTVGSNNLSTTFSGVMQDGGQNGGTGGSLTKIGTGTLDLTGANTYTGDTNVNRGVLQVDGSITSNTFVNRGSTLAGAGTISGNVTNGGKVSPGSAGAPGMLTVVGNYSQAQYATLMIQIAGANAGEFSVLNVLGTANLTGQLDPVLLNGFVPTIGESFTFLTYGSVNGTLFMFNRNIDNLPEHWEVGYLPTFAILTVAPGNVSVPDQGSTLLLLTLGLLALSLHFARSGTSASCNFFAPCRRINTRSCRSTSVVIGARNSGRSVDLRFLGPVGRCLLPRVDRLRRTSRDRLSRAIIEAGK